MKILLQIGIIFAICFLGEIVSVLIPFNFPSSVISMIILFLLLLFNLLKIKHIKEKSDFLLKNIAFFFIPSGVAIIDNMEYLNGNIIKILFICFITLIFTFISTAYTVKFVMLLQNKIRSNKNNG